MEKIVSENLEQDIKYLMPILQDLYHVDAMYRHADRLAFSLTPIYDRARSLKLVRDRLSLAGYDFQINETDSPILLSIDPRRKLRIPWLNVFMFIATVITVYFVPVYIRSNLDIDLTFQNLAAGHGIRFVIALVSILLVHEMGHFIAARRRSIITSWPFFIPAPNLIGTFGAVIKSKSPFYNRRDLLEMGAAGPIAGWIVALCWLVYGLSFSSIVRTSALQFSDLSFSLEGESMLMRFLAPILIGPVHYGYAYVFSEYAFAGWVGLLVTSINLLPIGQLDGGHILYGLVGKHQRLPGWIAMGILFILGFQSPMWWMFALFGLIFKVNHPPTLDDTFSPSRTAVAMGLASLLILVISFTPVPFQ
jgi:hypothetical protein